MFNFEGQSAIVTGGTRGIGAAITRSFLKSGAKVIATYSGNDENALAFKESLGEHAASLTLKKFDVSDFKACENFFNELDSDGTQIEVLINNAGIRRDNIVASMTGEEWGRVIDVNLTGTFNMTKFAILHFMKKRYGRIINMSSIGGTLGLPGQANYAASKAGQIAMAKSISKEVGKRGITINCVCPGFIETELISDLPADQVKEYKSTIPLKRFGSTDDVAHGVLFLASREASYITGTCLEITGGL